MKINYSGGENYMGIQLFVPTFNVDRCMEEIKECLEKGWTGLGFKTVEFEDKWKEYTGHRNAHFLSSATAGLHLAVKIFKMKYDWKEDDEIISTPMTFVSSNHAIAYENIKIKFADVDEFLCLDPKSVRKQITDKTKAILFVGLGGNTGKLEEIMEICKEFDLKLILDAAHMAGTRFNGETPGIKADCTVYSFQAVKNLPTADSGMICFTDKEDDEVCRKLAWLGINKDTYARTNEKGNYKWKYDVEHLGYKYHGNSIMAGIAIAQLETLDKDNAYRRQICTWYDSRFKDIDGIKCVPIAEGCESSRHLYVIEVDNRDELLEFLNKNEVFPGVHYRDNTEYHIYAYGKEECKNSSRMSDRIISLPLHMRLSKKDIDYVADKVIEFVKGI